MISHNADVLTQRITLRLKRLDPKSKETKIALLRIGHLIANRAKLKIRSKKIVDTGALLNSIVVELGRTSDGSVVTVGSAGIPYAAIHEFGGPFTPKMRRAMFAAMKRAGKLNKNKNKNVIVGTRVRARPFLRPALLQSSAGIAKILAGLIHGN